MKIITLPPKYVVKIKPHTNLEIEYILLCEKVHNSPYFSLIAIDWLLGTTTFEHCIGAIKE